MSAPGFEMRAFSRPEAVRFRDPTEDERRAAEVRRRIEMAEEVRRLGEVLD